MMTHPLPDVDATRLEAITAAVRADIESGLYYGASIKVARHGSLVLDITEGSSDERGTRPIAEDSVFSIFSITKAFVNVLVLRWVELGRLALTTKMVDVIPEFAGEPRERATIFHFLTHTTGMPGVWEPAPDLLLDVLEETVGHVVRLVHGVVEPGTRCDYSPMANHALLAAALVRTDPAGRDIATIMREELFDPLGMSDTALGIKSWMRERHIEPEMRGVVPIRSLSRTTPGDFGLHLAESNESAWAGGASTAADLLLFAEMLRREGAAPGGSIISPTTMRRARTNWTGDMPNELYRVVALRAGYEVPPAYLGLGFNVRGDRMVNTQLGTLTSPQTFGNYGAGSALYWVDPELDVTFVGLTAGLLPQAANIARFQRLSDMVVGAMR
ncbi:MULTISPECIES: serine hydrolase [unclassified Microbacterium]|uniref:serine hydrolase domain-containing protein n=1 Tax=unclassified Microbacterium TaxID=2609290 RepID=UPI000C2C9DF7|nr:MULTISPECIES: serine hydrolase domain-containing protein [unclassified Microbacterium]